MAAEIETELQHQLEEQREALDGVQQLLAAGPSAEEAAGLEELAADLKAGIKETEEALLGLTRQRLLAELDALHGVSDQQQQAQAQAAGATAEEAGEGGPQPWQPGSLCVFRWTDGRYYHAAVVDCDASNARLQFLHPTRSFQLEPVTLPAAALHPAPANGWHSVAAEQLQPGLRVIVQPAGSQLWQAAELAEVDVVGQRVAAITLHNKQRHVLPVSAVATSAHAPDPHASGDSDGDDEDGPAASGRGSAGASYFRNGDGSGGAWDAGSSEDEEGSSYSGSGSGSGSGSVSEEEAAGEGGGNDYEDEDEGGWEGYGGAAFGRVSLAMAEAAGLMQQQAEAGPQSETHLFFLSEAHSRGIGSKLLARMGYRGAGHGLGRQQQGMQQALQATQLRKGAGLGVDAGTGTEPGGKKRKRSGKQRRRGKAAKAALDGREAQRQKQRELEQKTGSEGLFAVLNSIIGDSSQAQAVKESNLGMRSSSGGNGSGGVGSGTTRQFFGSAGGGGGAGGSKSGPKEEDRRALARRADELSQLRQKVKRLSEMAGRNARDKVMLPQIKRALAEAQAQLAAAESQHAATNKSIHDREKLKRMTKF